MNLVYQEYNTKMTLRIEYESPLGKDLMRINRHREGNNVLV